MDSAMIKVVHHRNGQSSIYTRVHLSLNEVVRRAAIMCRLLPPGSRNIDSVSFSLRHEKHGSRVYCYLTLSVDGVSVVVTKTQLAGYYGAYISDITEDGISFWDNESCPNSWILADVFCA